MVEIRCGGVNKGASVLKFLSNAQYDFILAIGDDWTDEDIFKALPESACSIRVGRDTSHAKYNLQSYVEVVELLEQILRSGNSASSHDSPKQR